GFLVTWAHVVRVDAYDFRLSIAVGLLSAFGLICVVLVGLELDSIMGYEIRDPERTLPGAVALGGVFSGLLYIGATLTLLLAVPKNEIGVLQGVVQAAGKMAQEV